MKTLTKEFGYLNIGQAVPNIYTLESSANGWRQVGAPSGTFINTTYFDLAGLAIDDKTLFFSGATTQDVLNPIVTSGVAGDNIIVVDVMSSIPLTDVEYSALLTHGNFPISGTNNLTFDQTIYCRIRQYAVDVDTAAWGSMVLLADNQLGSLNPTASDRVYVARVVYFDGDSTAINVTPVRYLLRADAKEEAEYQYLMRLKRSYELQHTFDRD
jgi:hypothetical protein